MKKFSVSLCLIFCCVSIFAQKKGQERIDSLIAAIPSVTPDSSKAKLLIDISNSYANSNPAEGLRYAEQAIALTEKISFTQGMIDAYNAAGLNYKTKGDYTKAIHEHTKALALAEKINDKKNIGLAYGGMGSNYLYQGLYPKALEHYLKALKIFEELGQVAGMASNIGNIGSVYSYLKEYDKSIEYYERALKLQEELGNKNGIAANSGNAGYVYLYKGNYEKAIQYINRSMKLNEELGNINAVAGNAHGVGRIYQAQHNYVKAVENYEKALALSEKIGNKTTTSQNLLTTGEVYLLVVKDSAVSPFPGELATRKGLLAKALSNANRAIALRKETKDLNGLNFAYDTKSEIELLSGDAIAALASYQEHIRYRDSVFNIEKSREISRRELQYEFGKREDSIKYQQVLTSQRLERQELLGKQQEQQLVLNQQQLQLVSKEKDLERLTHLQQEAKLQREKEVQVSLVEKNKLEAKLSKEKSDQQIAEQQLQIGFDKKIKVYLAMAVASILLIAFLVYYNQQKTKKLNRIIGKQKEELEELGHVKDKIFSVVSHDMRAPVNNLISFIDILEDDAIPADKLQLYAGELKNQLSHTSVLMENLLNWASSQMKGFTPRIEKVDVRELVNETVAVLEQQARNKNIRISNHSGNGINTAADKNMLALVIRNIISNAIKFTPANGAINIDAGEKNDKIAITVTDNGTGMPSAKVTSFNDPMYLNSIDTKRGTQGETGTGLGLMLCKTFAGLMQGSMRVDSKEGEGSVFTLVLQVA